MSSLYYRCLCTQSHAFFGSLPSDAPISSIAQGKRKEVTIAIPSVTVFLPRGLWRAFGRSPQAKLVIGWCFRSGPTNDKVTVVVAGLITREQMIESSIRPAEDLEDGGAQVCIIGACNTQDTFSPAEECDRYLHDASKVWLEVEFLARQGRRSKRAVVTGLKASLESGSSTICAITVILYTTPRSERMKFLSLEPMVLPTASSAGILNRASTFLDTVKDSHLQHKLEALIRLDPMRYQEIASVYPSHRSPGHGFRIAVDLVGVKMKRRKERQRLTCTSAV